ncbi:conserved hypothetical protein [Caldicellulosiruptor hydrothermalis 108]|uniref:Rod shape-determining protein MreD n=1 Tax=Caldicellulosiruptor hydrothermalis (strain DSM 18901 / VKM B-2411 / 108) TaxID=632292 RepID=E4QAW2_CALH1|nr:hypothetical protein [Caldicellulosiruptor hydrothermalis]ADQ07140.1 conserved hypothetical protein [Caldicellulosiruptor hydrothermalis 108]
MLKNKLILHGINIVIAILFQTVLQEVIQIKGNTVLLFLPLIVSNAIFFDFSDAIIANLFIIFVFCFLFTNSFFLNLFLMVLLVITSNRLKEKIYLQRVEIFLLFLLMYIFSLNLLQYVTIGIAFNRIPLPSVFLSNSIIQFILDSVFGIFIYFTVLRESKYLLKLKKGRNLKEE